LAQAGVEAESLEAGLEEPRVLPQTLDGLRLLLEYVERGDAGGGHRGRMRGREQERSGAVIEKIDERAAAGHVTPERANGLRQSSRLDVDPAMHPEMIDRSPAVPSEHPARVRIVDHHDATELFGQLDELRDRSEVAVHAE